MASVQCCNCPLKDSSRTFTPKGVRSSEELSREAFRDGIWMS